MLLKCCTQYATDLEHYGGGSSSAKFGGTAKFNAYGNVMSLINSENYQQVTGFTENYALARIFHGATNLISAEHLILPVTTLYNGCYYGMFKGCRSLTTAPELPATTLAPYCYEEMFYYCTSLNYIKCLATDISATECTYMWLNNAAASGTFVKNPDMNDWPTGISGIPSGWTVIDAE